MPRAWPKCLNRFSLAVLLAVCVAPALGQRDPADETVSFDCHNLEIRRAIAELFGKVRCSFSMDPRIRGVASAHLVHMRWDRALLTFLAASHLTYRVEGGVFQIIQREERADDPAWVSESQIDPSMLIGPPEAKSEPLRIENGRAADVLWSVLSKSRSPFVIGVGLDTRVTADDPGQRLGKTLTSIVMSAHGGLACQNGIWLALGPRPAPLSHEPPP